MMHAARQHGARLHHGQVTGVQVTGVARRGDAIVGGIEVNGETIRADAVVIAMGPWSLRAAEWLPVPAVFGLGSPSLVYDTGKDVPAEALFLEYQEERGNVVTVEVFPRADGSTHVTAFSGQDPLPQDPATLTRTPVQSADFRRFASACHRRSVRKGSSPDKPAFVPLRRMGSL